MVWIFRDKAELSNAPAGTYVYRWWHSGIPRYVGVGKAGRWRSHLDGTRDVNPRKADYFIRHSGEMSCEIIRAGMSKEAAHEIEAALIKEHGFIDEGGTLLNMMRGSRPPQPTGRETPIGKRLYFALMKLPPFAPNAIITTLSPSNPKKINSGGRENFELYPPQGCSISVAEHNRIAEARGYVGRSQHEHLCWDVAHRFISVTLRQGENASPDTTVPTEEFMQALETQLNMLARTAPTN